MNRKLKNGWPVMILVAMLLVMLPAAAGALINGDAGSLVGSTRTFTVQATDGWITMGDGTAAYMWGYASATNKNPVCPAGNCMQYPGPTFIVSQGDTVVVHLTNNIPNIPGNAAVNTSIVFPGQNVKVTGGVGGLLTGEAASGGGGVTYTFTATNPGTYTYYSGTQSELQVEMGLMGALIVRPSGVPGANCPAITNPTAPHSGYAYCVGNAYFDREYLFVTSEIDPVIHSLIEAGQMPLVDNTARHETAWFVNGRNFPDTMSGDYVAWLPHQPYAAFPIMHPLESVLMRMVSGGRNLHPYHTHGQNHSIIARDGRLLMSSLAQASPVVADMPVSDYTTTTIAGETIDAVFGPWTGYKLGWDIFGPVGHCSVTTGETCKVNTDCATGETCVLLHPCNPAAAGPLTTFIAQRGFNALYPPGFDATTAQWCGDYGKDIPVNLPAPSKVSFGPFYGGTPYLGIPGELPPIPDPHTGDYLSDQNPLGGLQFMWHSHSEREITTNNIFIGGMASLMLVLPYTDNIP